jgi:hypothetical protein
MRRTAYRVGLAMAVACMLAGQSWAGEIGQCIKAASVDYKECKGVCKEDYQTAKDGCINKDHVCVEACREERSDCRDATGFDAAIRACNDAQQGAIANCKQIFGAGTPERDQCIDNAQLDGFQCRDQVREDNKAELKACRTAFKTCVGECPPGSGPADDPKQCRLDAKSDYKTCGASCREDFQIGKDACRHLDHDCVEGCRADRETCKDPVQASLDAAVAQCKATKQAAIAACNGVDACIDQAQAVAFQCRDDAREAAKPGFEACRQGFKTCVQGCPAASPSGAFVD